MQAALAETGSKNDAAEVEAAAKAEADNKAKTEVRFKDNGLTMVSEAQTDIRRLSGLSQKHRETSQGPRMHSGGL